MINVYFKFGVRTKELPYISFTFKGGESAALERMKEYFWNTDAIATYKETRNNLSQSP